MTAALGTARGPVRGGGSARRLLGRRRPVSMLAESVCSPVWTAAVGVERERRCHGDRGRSAQPDATPFPDLIQPLVDVFEQCRSIADEIRSGRRCRECVAGRVSWSPATSTNPSISRLVTSTLLADAAAAIRPVQNPLTRQGSSPESGGVGEGDVGQDGPTSAAGGRRSVRTRQDIESVRLAGEQLRVWLALLRERRSAADGRHCLAGDRC